MGAESRDRDVIRDAQKFLPSHPLRNVVSQVVENIFDMPVDRDLGGVFGAHDFPRRAVLHPRVGKLHLVAVAELLFEKPVLVVDAIPDSGQVEGGQRIQEAGRKASETAVPQPHVVFFAPQGIHVEAELAEGILDILENSRAIHAVDEQAPHEEFQREIIDPFDVAVVVDGLRGDHPLDDDALHRLRGRDPPVPRRRRLGVTRQREFKLVEDKKIDREFVRVFGVHDVWVLLGKIRARARRLRRTVCWC